MGVSGSHGKAEKSVQVTLTLKIVIRLILARKNRAAAEELAEQALLML